MAKNEIVIERLKTDHPTKILKVKVDYDIGGMNYFQGVSMKRGIYLSVTPVEERLNSTTVVAFSGTTSCIAELKRFSQKALADWAAKAKELPVYRQLIDHVLAKNGLKLAE